MNTEGGSLTMKSQLGMIQHLLSALSQSGKVNVWRRVVSLESNLQENG